MQELTARSRCRHDETSRDRRPRGPRLRRPPSGRCTSRPQRAGRRVDIMRLSLRRPAHLHRARRRRRRQRHGARPRRPAARLRAAAGGDQPHRPGDRRTRDRGRRLPRPAAELAQRRRREVRRQHLVHRPQLRPPAGLRPEPQLGDHVYCPTATSSCADGFEKPNGLAFSPDESVLYVGDSEALRDRRLRRPPRPRARNRRGSRRSSAAPRTG